MEEAEPPPPPTKTVQQRLNEGETPLAIFTDDNSFLDSLYGKTYEGGLIAYLNTSTGAGFVVAPSDLSTTYKWEGITFLLMAWVNRYRMPLPR